MAGVLTKKGKKRYYTLMKDVLLWYAEIPGEGRPSLLSQFTKSGVQPRGSIKLQADCVVLTDQADPFSFSITSRGKIYKLTGSTVSSIFSIFFGNHLKLFYFLDN